MFFFFSLVASSVGKTRCKTTSIRHEDNQASPTPRLFVRLSSDSKAHRPPQAVVPDITHAWVSRIFLQGIILGCAIIWNGANGRVKPVLAGHWVMTSSRNSLPCGDLLSYGPSRQNTMPSPEGQSGPEHYHGPINPRNYALQGAVGNTYMRTKQNETPPPQPSSANQYAVCPPVPCGYPNSNRTITACRVPVNCASAPEHFRITHDVRDVNRSAYITCAWIGCNLSVLRNNLIRHIREVHLDHGRNTGH